MNDEAESLDTTLANTIAWIRANPLRAVAIGFAVGFVLGLIA